MLNILQTKDIEEQIKSDILKRISELEQEHIHPTLAIVNLEISKDDLFYAKSIINKFASLGISVQTLSLGSEYSLDEKRFENLNNDKDVHGIIVLGKVPNSYKSMLSALKPYKDVDCYLDSNKCKIFLNDYPYFFPCTPLSVLEILKHFKIEISGKSVLVIGRSLVVGKPLSMMLLNENATVTIAHSKTRNLKKIISYQDIIITCAGKAELLSCEDFKDGQTVIDVGINFKDGKLCGDVSMDKSADKNISITPVPGGVGAITTLILARQVANVAYDGFE